MPRIFHYKENDAKLNIKMVNDDFLYDISDFRNSLGVWVIMGLHVLPIWLFGIKFKIFDTHLYFIPSVIVNFGK